MRPVVRLRPPGRPECYGFFLNGRHILTAEHNLDPGLTDATPILVTPDDGKSFKAKLCGVVKGADVACLRPVDPVAVHDLPRPVAASCGEQWATFGLNKHHRLWGTIAVRDQETGIHYFGLTVDNTAEDFAGYSGLPVLTRDHKAIIGVLVRRHIALTPLRGPLFTNVLYAAAIESVLAGFDELKPARLLDRLPVSRQMDTERPLEQGPSLRQWAQDSQPHPAALGGVHAVSDRSAAAAADLLRKRRGGGTG